MLHGTLLSIPGQCSLTRPATFSMPLVPGVSRCHILVCQDPHVDRLVSPGPGLDAVFQQLRLGRCNSRSRSGSHCPIISRLRRKLSLQDQRQLSVARIGSSIQLHQLTRSLAILLSCNKVARTWSRHICPPIRTNDFLTIRLHKRRSHGSSQHSRISQLHRVLSQVDKQ